MEYRFLQDIGSLLEVFTAIYVSMFLDDILKNIWTPEYKKRISQLIEEMKIQAISYFVKKVEDNIDENAKGISGHMKRKSTFLLFFCLSLLFLAGIETRSVVLNQYGFLIVTVLSFVALACVFLGRWMFKKYKRVFLTMLLYGIFFILLLFARFQNYINDLTILQLNNYYVALISVLVVLTLPIIWQLFLIWIYSSLYKGYMQERISREAYIYGKAYLAYKIKDMAALPKEYEMVAKDFVNTTSQEGDTSLSSLNTILEKRLEMLCELPNVLKVFFSWIKYIFRGRHNIEAEYIAANGFDYDELLAAGQKDQIQPSIQYKKEGIVVESLKSTGVFEGDGGLEKENKVI